MPTLNEPSSRFVSATDGLLLHCLDYGSTRSSLTPIICLPGLTRNARDFDPLAKRLAIEGRRVLAIDYRGRGRSQWDRDWQRYNLDIEREDILAVCQALAITRAIFVGTSRGGLHIFGLTAARPALIAAAILNDVGPVIQREGLIRIKLRIRQSALPDNWSAAGAMLRETMGARFGGLSNEDWQSFARMTFVEKDGRLAYDFDPRLARALEIIGPDMAPIDLWPQFIALSRVPVLAIRGENSDVLSPETFDEMKARSPAAFKGVTIGGQGHAPLLTDGQAFSAIAAFVSNF